MVASVASPTRGNHKVRPRRCHGQRRVRPSRCPPLHSVPRPAQCHDQLPLSLNRCPQWPACHLLTGHLLQPNGRPHCQHTRFLKLNCCPLANTMIRPNRGLYPAVIATIRNKRRFVHAATCHVVSHAQTRGSVATAPRPSLVASGCRSGARQGSKLWRRHLAAAPTCFAIGG